MPFSLISSLESNQDAAEAKKAADKGPVLITDGGRPAYVLLTFEDYQRLLGRTSLVELLAMDADVDFEPPRLSGSYHNLDAD